MSWSVLVARLWLSKSLNLTNPVQYKMCYLLQTIQEDRLKLMN